MYCPICKETLVESTKPTIFFCVRCSKPMRIEELEIEPIVGDFVKMPEINMEVKKTK